jgi:hypothetical protein
MSDHPEIIEPIKKMLEERRIEEHKVEVSADKTEAVVDLVLSPNREANDPSEAMARNKAVRAIGFLEGMSAWLWTQVGPDIDDAEVVEFDKRVADIAAYIGLPPRDLYAE